MTGRQNIEVVNNIAMIVINIALNYFLITAYGSVGAAIATGISIGGINLVRLLQVYIIYKIQPYNMRYIPQIICGIVSVILLYFLELYLPDLSYMLSLVYNVLVVVFAFVIPFVIIGFNDEDKLIFAAISNKFKSKNRFPKDIISETPIT
jgi:hypothetical protein